jgi:hypothetical protein
VLDPRAFGWSPVEAPPLPADGWADLLWTGRHLVALGERSVAIMQP